MSRSPKGMGRGSRRARQALGVCAVAMACAAGSFVIPARADPADSTSAEGAPSFPEWVRPGAPVRAIARVRDRENAVRGEFRSQNRDTLYLRTARGLHPVPIGSVVALDVSWEFKPRTWRGAWIGGLALGVVGAILGAGEAGDYESRAQAIASGAFGFGFFGSLMGAWLGSGAKSDRWYRVFPQPTRIELQAIPAISRPDSLAVHPSVEQP